MGMTKSIGRGVLELVYPPVCHLCNNSQPIGEAHAICLACVKQLRQLRGPQCRRCGAVFPQATEQSIECPFCGNEDYAFKGTVAWGSYQLSLRTVILKLKDLRSESLAYHVGGFLLVSSRHHCCQRGLTRLFPSRFIGHVDFGEVTTNRKSLPRQLRWNWESLTGQSGFGAGCAPHRKPVSRRPSAAKTYGSPWLRGFPRSIKAGISF